MWKLERLESRLPKSYFWTWDHSTNWMLDDPGILNAGCFNKYLKRTETFIEDYKRLIDLCAGIGIQGITIYGFLRESHGGIESAKILIEYAKERNITIMPGIGLSFYGGFYYEGNHRYNTMSFLSEHPSARFVTQGKTLFEFDESGNEIPNRMGGICPSSPEYRQWAKDGFDWLINDLGVDGANIENGDYSVCNCERCTSHLADWPHDEPDFYRMQYLAYEPVVKKISELHDNKMFTLATYSGFVPRHNDLYEYKWNMPEMQCNKPKMFDLLSDKSIFQWTITGMLLDEPLSMIKYLDDGAPDEAFDNPNWPEGINPPCSHSIGLLHQASQWWVKVPRYNLIISQIKEACLRSYRSGLEGVSIHGEVTSMYIPWALNYLAFSHFTHYPEDSMRDFGKKTLGQVFNSESEGELFIELLCMWDSKNISNENKETIYKYTNQFKIDVEQGHNIDKWRFWDWLKNMISGVVEKYTASFY